ncbi:MAG: tRNA pseudouridine(38-40) synthase TruA, partial [Rhodospirillales bacterium 12-54-5]
MPRYKLTIEYDGAPFHGWQKQEGIKTVQGALEEAFAKFVQAPVEVVCAGRTDARVHARGQVAHVDLPMHREPVNIRKGVNTYLLPNPIVILKAEPVGDDFHARFDAKSRHYLYRILNRSSWPTVDAAHVWHVPQPMDLDAMREAATHLIGHHDFTTFRDRECQANSPMRTLDTLEITQLKHRPEQVMVKLSARSFLHHQVRNMMGGLMLVGTGKWAPDDMQKAMEARDRVAGGPTAPAHALYFMK